MQCGVLCLRAVILRLYHQINLTGDRTKSVMYKLALTNFEIKLMFEDMIPPLVQSCKNETNEFIKALICGDIESMNDYMNKVALKLLVILTREMYHQTKSLSVFPWFCFRTYGRPVRKLYHNLKP